MSKMDDDALLTHLQRQEEDSAQFTWGKLATQREQSMKEYFREPYGNEEEGSSSIVTSEVQDTVESILPELLDIFTSTDQAVVFEPSRAEDVKGAQQATDACNHVFYKQNNGFLTLYVAIKDALLSKNCAVMWRKQTNRAKTIVPVKGASEMVLTAILQDAGEGAKVESATPRQQPVLIPQTNQPFIGLDGQPVMETVYDARVSKIEERTVYKVEAFPPENLNVKRDWTSPLLQDCPYVSRLMQVSLSDLNQMGFDATAEELAASADASVSADSDYRKRRAGGVDDTESDETGFASDDETLTTGYLRIEWVLVDFDGDGIAERREVYRLKDKILSNEETSHVPVATSSPILVPHRWDGMSIAEIVSDLQLLKTELTRQIVNNAYLANNPRKKVLTDDQGAPFANIDDLLDDRVGGIMRQTRLDAITIDQTPFVGNQMFPLLGYVDQMSERRTGVSDQQRGLDPNSLRPDRTAAEVMMTSTAAKQRIKLIARIFAETLVKPIFQGLLKLLTDGGMEKLAFRLNGEFVEYDPNEWRDSYDMTSNVGLGTGDRQQQQALLMGLHQSQMAISQSPYGKMLVTPQQMYATLSKLVENAGMKNVGDFWTDPKGAPMPDSPPPLPLQIKQMELAAEKEALQVTTQLEVQRVQFEHQAKQREQENDLELQKSNDERDAAREALKAQYDAQVKLAEIEAGREKVLADNRTRIITARIAHPTSLVPGFDIDGETGEVFEKPDPIAPLAEAIAAVIEQGNAPKVIVRDEAGKVAGVQHGGQFRQVVRDGAGRVLGVQ